jgi:hypothetical protein
MSPPLRASNEGLLKPRVARAQGIHRTIPPLLAGFFSILLAPLGEIARRPKSACVAKRHIHPGIVGHT